MLAKLLKGSHLSMVLNEHYDGDGGMFSGRPVASAARASCQSELAHPIAPGRSVHWVKVKNPKHRLCGARPKRIGGDGNTQAIAGVIGISTG